MNRESGFSLVELVISIAIISILLVIAVPQFVDWVPKYRAKGAAQDLFSNLQGAKVAAIRNRQDCVVTFGTGPDQYQITLINKTVTLSDYGSGVKFSSAPSPTTITFNSRGFCNSAVDVDITNSSNSVTYRVSVLTSGVVSVN